MNPSSLRRVTLPMGCLALGAVWLAAAGRPATADSVRLHVRVETRGGTGEQQTRYWAFTSRDEAGVDRVAVGRLCVTGIGYETRERCVTEGSEVELEERTTGLTGLGSRCVEAVANAVWETVPLTATARACP